MFPEWISLSGTLQEEDVNRSSLQNFPRDVAVELCRSICKNLAPRSPITGYSSPLSTQPVTPALSPQVGGRTELQQRTSSSSVTGSAMSDSSKGSVPSPATGLENEETVQYSMEVISYALSLDFESEHDIIRDAVLIYADWLSVLAPSPKSTVPDCLRLTPNLYAQRMIKHLFQLFVPRPRQGSDPIGKQCALCQRVLRALQEVFKISTVVSSETWDVLLQTLLSITDTVLSQPPETGDFAEYISKLLLSFLFDIWLLACQRSFPAAVYWKTFSQMSRAWRHRLPVVEEWLRVSVLLSEKVLQYAKGLNIGKSLIFKPFGKGESGKGYSDWKADILELKSPDLIVQTQIRFLLLLGNVAEVASKEALARPEKLLHMISVNTLDSGAEISSVSAQAVVPLIFLKVITGVTSMVDMVMNMMSSMETYLDINWPGLSPFPYAHPISAHDPALQMPGPSTQFPVTGLLESPILFYKSRPLRCETRIPCRGPLYLFGPWLFRASLVHRTDAIRTHVAKNQEGSNEDQLEPVLTALWEGDVWQPGRAEAVGTLCRLYSFMADGSTLHAGLVARMGLVLSRALAFEGTNGYVLSNAIRNCHDIFRAGYPGLETLLPVLIPALEVVLLQKLPKNLMYPEIKEDELRSSALHLLSSIICLPKYFDLLVCRDIRNALERSISRPENETFGSTSYRLLDLILRSICDETNSGNCMLLLGCLYVLFTYSFSVTSLEDNPEVRFDYGKKVYYAVCHLLQKDLWLHDQFLSSACLEFLHTSARHSFSLVNQSTCKMVLLKVCQYIQIQSGLPSKNHSKDLHNRIILAYHCLLSWLQFQPTMLQDPEVLITVAEVIETGLTGNKQAKMLKATQSFAPISTRVRDAAELVLLVVLELVGTNSDPGCSQFMDNLVSEEDILADLPKSHSRHFLYFTTDGTSILAVLCGSGSNGPLFVIQRSLSCRRAFYFEPVKCQNPAPESSSAKNTGLSATDKFSETTKPDRFESEGYVNGSIPSSATYRMASNADWDFVAFRNEVPGYNKIEKCLADDMLPTFDDLLKINDTIAHDFNLLNDMFDQIASEVSFSLPEIASESPYQPPVVSEQNTTSSDSEAVVVAQLLYHLGLKPPVALSPSLYHTPCTVQLDHRSPSLTSSLAELDKISIRPLDWVLAFYVRKGDETVSDVIKNGNALVDRSEAFVTFLSSMAWPVRVQDLINRRPAAEEAHGTRADTDGINRCDGLEWCLLSSDICHELGIVVPSSSCLKTSRPNGIALVPEGGVFTTDHIPSLHKTEEIQTKIRSYSVDDIDPAASHHHPLSVPLRSAHGRPRKPSVLSEGKFFVILVWVESFEDKDSFVFPAHEMLRSLDIDHLLWQSQSEEGDGDHLSNPPGSPIHTVPAEFRLIYICPSGHDMYEVRLRNMENNTVLAAVPLVNGMILSHGALGSLVRDCAVNLFAKKRLALEQYIPGQIRRRNVIQEMTNKFRSKDVTESSWGP